MSSNLTLEQLQSKLATATGLKRTVITNQINRLITQLQALIPAPPPARAPITRKRLTLLEQLKLSELTYSTPQRGYKLYNPVKDTYISNTKLNRANVKRQIEKLTKRSGSNTNNINEITTLISFNRFRLKHVYKTFLLDGLNQSIIEGIDLILS